MRKYSIFVVIALASLGCRTTAVDSSLSASISGFKDDICNKSASCRGQPGKCLVTKLRAFRGLSESRVLGALSAGTAFALLEAGTRSEPRTTAAMEKLGYTMQEGIPEAPVATERLWQEILNKARQKGASAIFAKEGERMTPELRTEISEALVNSRSTYGPEYGDSSRVAKQIADSAVAELIFSESLAGEADKVSQSTEKAQMLELSLEHRSNALRSMAEAEAIDGKGQIIDPNELKFVAEKGAADLASLRPLQADGFVKRSGQIGAGVGHLTAVVKAENPQAGQALADSASTFVGGPEVVNVFGIEGLLTQVGLDRAAQAQGDKVANERISRWQNELNRTGTLLGVDVSLDPATVNRLTEPFTNVRDMATAQGLTPNGIAEAMASKVSVKISQENRALFSTENVLERVRNEAMRVERAKAARIGTRAIR